MHHNNMRCNAYQTVNSLTWHATNTPSLTIEILSHIGLAVSQTSINNMIDSLSKKQMEGIQEWAKDLLVGLAYDNFDMMMDTSEPSLLNFAVFWNAASGTILRLYHVLAAALHCSRYLWDRSPLNRHRKEEDQPPPVEWNDLLPPPEDIPTDGHPLIVWLIAWHLRKALVTAVEFRLKGYGKYLGNAEPKKKILVVKTEQMPVKAMDIKQSTNDGQSDILAAMLKAAGLGDSTKDARLTDINEYVLLVHSNLSTFERLMAVMSHRSIEKMPVNRLQYVVFVPGLFHVLMACTDAIWRVLLQPALARKGGHSLLYHVGILRPRETGKFTSSKCPAFRAIHDVIMQDSRVWFRDCWRLEAAEQNATHTNLEAFAASNPSWESIEAMSISMAYKYFNITKQSSAPPKDNDEDIVLGESDCTEEDITEEASDVMDVDCDDEGDIEQP